MTKTIAQLLQAAESELKSTQVESFSLDAQVLLADLLGVDRAHLLAHPHQAATEKQTKDYQTRIKRRSNQQEPVAYITGHKEFYGLDFEVTPATLIPRPETEDLVEIALDLPPLQGRRGRNTYLNHSLNYDLKLKVLDVGTGCGNIAVSLAKHQPKWQITAVDKSPVALRVAAQNAKNHEVKVKFMASDLLAKVKGKFDLVVANLPYVRDDIEINEPAKQEPALAIFGGPDGLDLYRQLFAQLPANLNPEAIVITECMPDQQDLLAQVAAEYGFSEMKRHRLATVFHNGPR